MSFTRKFPQQHAPPNKHFAARHNRIGHAFIHTSTCCRQDAAEAVANKTQCCAKSAIKRFSSENGSQSSSQACSNCCSHRSHYRPSLTTSKSPCPQKLVKGWFRGVALLGLGLVSRRVLGAVSYHILTLIHSLTSSSSSFSSLS